MAENNQNTSNFGESLKNVWTNSLDTSQKEVENLLNQAFKNQRDSLDKITGYMGLIESEQKKLVSEVRDYVKENIQKVYGEQAGKSFEQWNEQLDEINNRVQQLTTSYLNNLLEIKLPAKDQNK